MAQHAVIVTNIDNSSEQVEFASTEAAEFFCAHEVQQVGCQRVQCPSLKLDLPSKQKPPDEYAEIREKIKILESAGFIASAENLRRRLPRNFAS